MSETPELLTIVDLSNSLHLDLQTTRRFVRRHRGVLKPFMAGREIRCSAANYRKLLDDLQTATN